MQNLQLQQEIAERERAEAALREHEAHLEKLVAARTLDLEEEIKARKETEKSLKDSEMLLSQIIDFLPDPTCGHGGLARHQGVCNRRPPG